jgi:predicted RND superfamily exporter protein
VGCGIDYSIYFLSYSDTARLSDVGCRMSEPNQEPSGSDIRHPTSDIARALKALSRPLIAGAATSIVGFAAVAFSSVHALRDFAILGSLGLTLCLAGVLWVLPALLNLIGRLPRFASPSPRLPSLTAPLTSPHLCIAICLLALLAAGIAVGLRPPRFETNLNVMHPMPNPPLETERDIGEKFGASDTLLLYIEAHTSDELVRRAHQAARAIDPLRADLSISGVFGLSTLLPDPQQIPARRAALANISADQVLADFDTAVADSSFDPAAFTDYKTFLRRLLTANQPPTLDSLTAAPQLATMLTSRDSAHPAALTIITLAPQHGTGEELTLQDARTRDTTVTTLRTALQGLEGVTLTGLPIIGYDIEHAVRRDLPIIIAAAAFIVLLILIPTFRSWRLAALSCIPVVFGIAVLLGYMAAAGEHFNLANIVAIPLLIGVGEDYGIFLVSMAGAQAKNGQLGDAAPNLPFANLRFAHLPLAPAFHAILLTSSASIIGFGSLAFTSVPAVQSMGRVVAVGIAACVIGALFLLAPILTPPPSGPDKPPRRR